MIIIWGHRSLLCYKNPSDKNKKHFTTTQQSQKNAILEGLKVFRKKK